MNMDTMNKVLNNLITWFDEISLDIPARNCLNLASSSTTWVHLRVVLLPLLNTQFFAFFLTEFGQLLKISLVTDAKLNLSEVW